MEGECDESLISGDPRENTSGYVGPHPEKMTLKVKIE
jgi:hypothetical protein